MGPSSLSSNTPCRGVRLKRENQGLSCQHGLPSNLGGQTSLNVRSPRGSEWQIDMQIPGLFSSYPDPVQRGGCLEATFSIHAPGCRCYISFPTQEKVA